MKHFAHTRNSQKTSRSHVTDQSQTENDPHPDTSLIITRSTRSRRISTPLRRLDLLLFDTCTRLLNLLNSHVQSDFFTVFCTFIVASDLLFDLRTSFRYREGCYVMRIALAYLRTCTSLPILLY